MVLIQELEFRNITSFRRLLMNRSSILFIALVVTLMSGAARAQERGAAPRIGIPGTPPAGPLASLVQEGADAYNKGDIAYFEKMFADDILWVDEDGHELNTKMFCVNFIRCQMT